MDIQDYNERRNYIVAQQTRAANLILSGQTEQGLNLLLELIRDEVSSIVASGQLKVLKIAEENAAALKRIESLRAERGREIQSLKADLLGIAARLRSIQAIEDADQQMLKPSTPEEGS